MYSIDLWASRSSLIFSLLASCALASSGCAAEPTADLDNDDESNVGEAQTDLSTAWSNLGKPAGANIYSRVGVLTVMDTPTSAQRPQVFVLGSDGNNWDNWWQ
jgi:hypothetical protein